MNKVGGGDGAMSGGKAGGNGIGDPPASPMSHKYNGYGILKFGVKSSFIRK